MRPEDHPLRQSAHEQGTYSWFLLNAIAMCAIIGLMTPLKNGGAVVCQACGREFYVPKYRLSKAKYCSRSCLAKIHLKQFFPIYGFKKLGRPELKYRTMMVDGKQWRVHRYVMTQHLGR